MKKRNTKYPNKADYEPYVNEHAEENGELPLADPAESNVTEVFRENEATVEGVETQSAFGQNREKK